MSNNTSRRGSVKSLRDTAEVATDHVSSVVADLEIATPASPTPRPTAKTVKPMHEVVDGKGAWVWVKTGDHQVEAQWSPTAPANVPTPLPISASDMALLIAIARKLNVPVANLDRLDPVAVRAARVAAANAPEFSDRYSEFTKLVEACRT